MQISIVKDEVKYTVLLDQLEANHVKLSKTKDQSELKKI
jgi:hypothetical protein